MSVFNIFFSLLYFLKMKKKKQAGISLKFYLKIVTSIIILMSYSYAFAQDNNDEVLARINGKKISIDEFVYFHKINNTNPLAGNKDTLTAQLNQFIDIKLNVAEAERKAYERKAQFINAFNNYQKHIAESLFINNETLEKLSQEAYQRIKYEVRASHILIKLSKYASPEDTLIAYEKAMNIKRRLIDTEKFENVAMEASDDPKAAINRGDLWYVGAFKMPYEVENYLFTAGKNKISDPIRSEQGYHILKIIDRRRNPGSIKVAQIMISLAENANEVQEKTARRKIDSLYLLASKSDNFSELAVKYSNDKGTMLNNGELAWFSSGEMPHKFETAAFKLQRKGEISKPIRSEYGWHIIKKIDQQKIAEYNLIKDQIKNNIYKSDRYRICKQNIIRQMQKKYHFKENKELNILYTAVDSTIFEKRWRIPFLIDLDGDLFEIAGKKYTKNDFAKWLEKNQKNILQTSVEKYVDKQYEIYKNGKLVEFAINELSKNNKIFGIQVKEFYDGWMLFSIMETEVRNKAKNDTIKLKQFYNQNINKYNNKYSANISVFKFESGTDIKRLKKYFIKYKKQNLTDNQLATKVSKSVRKELHFKSSYNAEEGQKDVFDEIAAAYRRGNLSPKQKAFILKSQNTLIYLNTPIRIAKKPWNFYKDELISDYQNYTYNQKVKNLRSRYNISINDLVLESLYKID